MTYLNVMPLGPIRRWFLLFVLGAFLCAGIARPMPTANAAPMGGMAGMSMAMAMDMGDAGGEPLPCKSNLPNCFSCIGCISMAALPPANILTATQLTWSRIVYASTTASHSGMSFQPDLGPPIQA